MEVATRHVGGQQVEEEEEELELVVEELCGLVEVVDAVRVV